MALFRRTPRVSTRQLGGAVPTIVVPTEELRALTARQIEPQQDTPTDASTATAESGGGVAAASESAKSTPHAGAALVGVVLFSVGLWLSVMAFGTDGGPTYTAAAGVGAFALFYIAAQSAERLVELILPLLERVPGIGKDEQVNAVEKALAKAYRPDGETDKTNETSDQKVAEAQAKVDQLIANRAIVAFGLTAGIGMWLCGYLEADFLTAVGVDFSPNADGISGTPDQALAMLVTGLVLGGGAKGLHDLITNVSKSSQSKDTPAELGGQK